MKIFKKMYQEQKDFQKYFFDVDNLSDKEKVFWSKESILAVHRELGEVLETLPWKPHQTKNKKISHKKLGIELIDCFKYLLNLFVIWNIPPEKITKLFFEKSKIVRKRYAKQKSKK